MLLVLHGLVLRPCCVCRVYIHASIYESSSSVYWCCCGSLKALCAAHTVRTYTSQLLDYMQSGFRFCISQATTQCVTFCCSCAADTAAQHGRVAGGVECSMYACEYSSCVSVYRFHQICGFDSSVRVGPAAFAFVVEMPLSLLSYSSMWCCQVCAVRCGCSGVTPAAVAAVILAWYLSCITACCSFQRVCNVLVHLMLPRI